MAMPYVSEKLQYVFVPADNVYMELAKATRDASTCAKQKTGAIVTKAGNVLGRGNNRVDNPPADGVCPRVTFNCPTGTGYEHCEETCHQQGRHAERDAIADALSNVGPFIIKGSTVFLYGHWWCCKDCCDAMEAAGIIRVVLVEGHGPDTNWSEV